MPISTTSIREFQKLAFCVKVWDAYFCEAFSKHSSITLVCKIKNPMNWMRAAVPFVRLASDPANPGTSQLLRHMLMYSK